jgi:PAP2 superfamily
MEMKMRMMRNGAIKKNVVLLGLLAATLASASLVAKADAVLDWNSIAVDTAVANGQNPFAQARYAAIVQLAVFEAVNSITQKYKPYLGITAPPGASPEAAAIEAAYRVLKLSFPTSGPTLDTELANALALLPDDQAKADGITTGDNAAKAITDLRANDGSSPPQFKIPGPPEQGEWQATASCPVNENGVQVGIAFQWRNITPFGVGSARDFLLTPPPALTSHRFARDYKELMRVGSIDSTERPQDRSDVALFYAASSPTQVFNQAARQVAQQQGRSLSENARALALMNMAISDSLVASFFNKYFYNFWRPETAIHAGNRDGNPRTKADPDYKPFVVTPCFPSYPSNHGSGGNAAASVLMRLYGEAGHTITLSNPALPNFVLQYTSFRQITDDISDARIYGGIHFRFDQVAGEHLGRAVGRAVYSHNLRPVHNDD